MEYPALESRIELQEAAQDILVHQWQRLQSRLRSTVTVRSRAWKKICAKEAKHPCTGGHRPLQGCIIIHVFGLNPRHGSSGGYATLCLGLCGSECKWENSAGVAGVST